MSYNKALNIINNTGQETRIKNLFLVFKVYLEMSIFFK